MGLWSELKRRNVLRVAAAYLVSAWVLIEVATVLFDTFEFPPFALKLLITILALGLVPTIIFSWVYELTPQGIQKDAGEASDNPESARTARRLDQVTISMIIVALAFVVMTRFVLPPRDSSPDTTGRVAEQMLSTPSSDEVETGHSPSAGSAATQDIPEASIAVLPFANMSPDPENAFFADGISEEILNVLAAIKGLKVASRTSAFSFRGKDASIRSIASQLGVANVLEGSVRKQGNQVRITAQLIDADTDAHLWSESYNRELIDVFAVQEEIANSITDALGDKLGVSRVAVRQTTSNLDAYEQFLRGRTLFYQRYAALKSARVALEDAVAKDPGFAEAWSFLAATYLVSTGYRSFVDVEETNPELFELAATAAERARSINDSLALPYAVLAQIEAENTRHLTALELFDGALSREPNNPSSLLWRGLLHLRAGHLKRAEADLEKAWRIDPLVGITNAKLGYALLAQGNAERGVPLMKTAISHGYLEPHLMFSAYYLAQNDAQNGKNQILAWAESAENPEFATVLTLFVELIDDRSRTPELVEYFRQHPEFLEQHYEWLSLLTMLGAPDDALDIAVDPEYLKETRLNPGDLWSIGQREIAERPRFF